MSYGQLQCTGCAPGRFGDALTSGSSNPAICRNCPHGKYQASQGMLECALCMPGRAGKHGEHGAVHGTHCQLCPAGQHQDASAKTHCKPCGRVDALRLRISDEGDANCRDKPLDCLPGQWGSFGSCSKSCRPMVGEMKDTPGQAGTHVRMRRPVPQMPCALSDKTECSQAWGGGKSCDSMQWQDVQPCNTQLCPVDCETNLWAAWQPCSRTCGGGTSIRVRTIKVPPARGGATCTLSQTSSCNEGISCDKWRLPTCQQDHVQCHVKQRKLNPNHPAPRNWMLGTDPATGGKLFINTKTGERTTEIPTDYAICAHSHRLKDLKWHTTGMTNDKYGNLKRTGRFVKREQPETKECIQNQDCGMADYGTCHECDSVQECKDVGLHNAVFVTNHRKHMHMTMYDTATKTRGNVQYHCRKDGKSGCICKCSGHTPCVAKANKLLRNKVLHANTYSHIPKMQDCCNLCTNHPACGCWEYSSSGTCVLKSGAPIFIPQPAATLGELAVWAGCPAGEAC